MKIGGIDFPEALLTAQKRANLVVFAGAGVSIPPPSNYPNFRDLADKVAGGTLTPGKDEPIDHFLGRLHDLKVKVHELVSTILADPRSRPNSLHFDLLRLFESSEAVRLVTTNFDLHFSTASSGVFPNQHPCEIYHAPALPLGHSFSGIVYLHGAVDKPPQRLVLTDSDLGRAYLTEGWARLFLQRVFETFTVLFVGYSHNDPVMNYLARGFTPEMGKSRRFALVPSGAEDEWTYRGVIPIKYHLAAGGSPHSSLPTSLSAWAEGARLGILEREQRIRAIVSLPPPIDLEPGDFIEDSLSEVSTARFFTRHADSISWMRWVEEKKLLKRLFDPSAVPTDIDEELGWWIADKFSCGHVEETLSVLRRQGQRLSRYLWEAIAGKLSRDGSKEENREARRRWIAVLINLRPEGAHPQSLEHIAESFIFPDDIEIAFLVFEYLSRPILRLERNLWSELDESLRENVSFELESYGSGFWLDHLWVTFFEPNLEMLSGKLEPMLGSHLQLAYFLSQADKGIRGAWDTLSLSRGLIEQPDHGRLGNGLGVLVDAAFDVVKWNVSNRHDRSDALIQLWFSADSFLLKRLAILAVGLSGHWSGDLKLRWLLDKDLLYVPGLKHEVFEVLKAAYPLSSEGLRKETVERANRERDPFPGDTDHTEEYEKYNLMYWLHQSDPSCLIAKAAFGEVQTVHGDFRTREHPDQDVVHGTMQIGLQSPFGVDELLAKLPSAQMDVLLSYETEGLFGPSREGLVANVTAAVIRNYEWSWQFAGELRERGATQIDLWSALVRGWAGSELPNDAWRDVLTLLDVDEGLHDPLSSEIADLLKDGIKKTSKPIPAECFDLIGDLSKRIWVMLRLKSAPPKLTSTETDWLMRAINHPAGRLTLFWLNWLARQRKEAGVDWKGIPDGIRKTFDEVLIDNSYAAELARVLLASQLNFLISADEAWTRNSIIPLFDWAVDGKRALQAFHGFLTWGQQTETLIAFILPMYEKAFSHISEFGKARNRFTQYLAALAVGSSTNPLTTGWLDRFMLGSEEKDRHAWTSQVGQVLRGSNDAARTAAWQHWIREYWNRRLSGRPVPIDAIELGEMVEWSLHLGLSFPEVVEMILRGPSFELRHSFFLRELADTTFPEIFPAATGNVLSIVLRNMNAVHFDLDKVENVVKRIAPLSVSPTLLKEICNELGRLGYAPAAALGNWIDTQPAQN